MAGNATLEHSRYKYDLIRWVIDGKEPGIGGETLTQLLKGNRPVVSSKFKWCMDLPAFEVWLDDLWSFLVDTLPSGCWGSPEKYSLWLSHHGFNGLSENEVIVAKLTGDYDFWLEQYHIITDPSYTGF